MARFWSIMVRVCPYSAGGFTPVVAWAVHVSVGKEIQRVTIASGGREREGKICRERKTTANLCYLTCTLTVTPIDAKGVLTVWNIALTHSIPLDASGKGDSTIY